jgi:NAD-dependent dihydropyrimidine dehydrogenase PreA subunit
MWNLVDGPVGLFPLEQKNNLKRPDPDLRDKEEIMREEIYSKLREFLDKTPGGFPTTESGVEMKILKKLFTPEQAKITLNLTLMPEPVSQIAQKLGMNEAEAAEKLEGMAKEGLIMRVRAGDQVYYSAISFVVGIWEFHLNTLDRELAELTVEYMPHLAESWKSLKTKPLRVVPIHASLQDGKAVSTYAQIRELAKDKQMISVAPCVCAKQEGLLGNPCDRPKERCIQFDMAAQYYIENGMSREISSDELDDLLKMGEEQALVLCPTNSKDIINICMCCGCCCENLKILKKYNRPADHCLSPYLAKIDPESCVMCGDCLNRCQMDAIREGDEAHEVDTARCIGCGLCVPTCPEQAISLVAKPDVAEIPENLVDMNLRLAQERGIL